MTFGEVYKYLKEGKKIKLRHWSGYWKLVDGRVKMYTKNGEIIDLQDSEDIMYTLSNIASDEWMVTADDYDFELIDTFYFGEAIRKLKQGKKVARKGWNGKGIYLKMYFPDMYSQMTLPFIFIVTDNLITDNPDAPKGTVPWLASQTDMLAGDWIVIPE